MKKTRKYNIIIYSCLLLAVILLILGGIDYLKNEEPSVSQEPEINEPTGEEEVERKEEPVTKEPQELIDADKEGAIKKYIDSLVDQIAKSKKLPYKMVKTWGDYSIGEIEYQRKITSRYYEYKVNVIIPNLDAKLPSKKNEKLSTDKYLVLTMYFDIVDSEKQNGLYVKNVDIIEE